MTGPHKVRVKIGDAEFEAEGGEELVKAQFADFLAALSAKPSQQHKPKANAMEPEDGLPDDAGNHNGDASSELINRAYLPVKDLISLRFLPKSENQDADTLLLLLYGYEKLKGLDSVLVTQLLRAAKQSGLSLDRIDRASAKYSSLLLKGGTRKGSKYSLNNQGRAKAIEILKAMFTT
jgi:hypothetical protein